MVANEQAAPKAYKQAVTTHLDSDSAADTKHPGITERDDEPNRIR